MNNGKDSTDIYGDNLISQHYVAVDGFAIHYRVMGRGPAVVLLHDSPRSSRLHLDTMRILSQTYTVFALDTPGYGNSAPLAASTPTIHDFAAALNGVLVALQLTDAPLYATHTSAKIALEYAASFPRTAPIVLDGLSIPVGPPNDAFIAAYMRPMAIEETGGYLAAEWTRMRDMVRWFPWFTLSAENRMPVPAPTDAWLDDYAIDFFAAGPHYSGAYKAAMYYDPMPALLRVTSPILVAARTDDVLYSSLDRVPATDNAHLTVQRLSDDRGAWMDWMISALATDVPAPATVSAPISSLSRLMLDLPIGRLHVQCAGPAEGTPLLLLSAPTTLQALEWQKALPDIRTLVPELPGFGESAPLAEPTLANVAISLLQMLDAADIAQIDILATGLTAPLAALLTQLAPDRIRGVVIDGCVQIAAEVRDSMVEQFAPSFAFDGLGGSHNHRYWHMLRDSEANFPWYAPDAASQRSTSPMLSADSLHMALVGILKQPGRYGDVARAAICESADAELEDVRARGLIFNRPNDAAYGAASAWATRWPNAQLVERETSTSGAADQLRDFLSQIAAEQGAAA